MAPSYLKRRLALVSFLAGLYPPVIVVVEALLSPITHRQELGTCAKYLASGPTKVSCASAPSLLEMMFTGANYLIFAAVLVGLLSGHLALHKHRLAAMTKSRRSLAVVGLVLGYAWAAIAAYLFYVFFFFGIE
jgi:hypothetical protein